MVIIQFLPAVFCSTFKYKSFMRASKEILTSKGLPYLGSQFSSYWKVRTVLDYNHKSITIRYIYFFIFRIASSIRASSLFRISSILKSLFFLLKIILMPIEARKSPKLEVTLDSRKKQ